MEIAESRNTNIDKQTPKKLRITETCQIQLDTTSFVDYYSGFIPNALADNFLQTLLFNIPWREVIRQGKEGPYKIPRLQCWMSDPGVEAGLTQKEPALEWSQDMILLKTRIEDELRSRDINVKFDYVLMNYYRDGNDNIGLHNDDEADEEERQVIASISLGETRTFKMQNKKPKSNPKYDFIASHGSCIIMRGKTQFNWLHGIPKNGSVTKPRINLTFRKS